MSNCATSIVQLHSAGGQFIKEKHNCTNYEAIVLGGESLSPPVTNCSNQDSIAIFHTHRVSNTKATAIPAGHGADLWPQGIDLHLQYTDSWHWRMLLKGCKSFWCNEIEGLATDRCTLVQHGFCMYCKSPGILQIRQKLSMNCFLNLFHIWLCVTLSQYACTLISFNPNQMESSIFFFVEPSPTPPPPIHHISMTKNPDARIQVYLKCL